MERRHWVRTAFRCNNHCMFCLDVDMQDGTLVASDAVREDIRRGRDLGAARLILSGGEASIHPEFIEFVRYGRALGYRHVQTITNGRMFAYRRFADAAVAAGLGEATFSMHGHTPELHDRLTRVPGGFEQAIRGMRNLIDSGRCVVNVDIVINRQNVEHVADIMDYFIDMGIHEFDLLHITPFGNAFTFRDELFYDIAAAMPSLRRAFDKARVPGLYVWTNRFPVNYLEGYEDLIQDPHKLFDEVNGRREMFDAFLDGREPLPCVGERCAHCFIRRFCGRLSHHVEALRNGAHTGIRFDAAVPPDERLLGNFSKWRVTAAKATNAAPFIGVEGKTTYLEAPRPETLSSAALGRVARIILRSPADLQALKAAGYAGELEVAVNRKTAPWLAAQAPALRDFPLILSIDTFETLSECVESDADFIAALTPLGGIPYSVRGVPKCLAPAAPRAMDDDWLDASVLMSPNRIEIDRFTESYIIREYNAKSLRCGACAADAACDGAHINYLRRYGFAALRPDRVTG